jgi:hypothetical protein
MWPGNIADVTTLLPVVKRMRERFRISEISIVADRGMVSQETLEAFETAIRQYAISLECGCAARRKLVCRGSAAEYAGLRVFRSAAKPRIGAPLKVKEVWVQVNAETVAHVHKALWTFEDIVRTAKSILETRPIYHKCDETIRGHVFWSFLALLLKAQNRAGAAHEIYRLTVRMGTGASRPGRIAAGRATFQDKRFLLRSQLSGEASAALRATGVAAPSTLRELP